MKTLKLKNPIHLLKTDFVINTLNVFIYKDVEFYKTSCEKAVVVKELCDIHGDNIFVYEIKSNLILKKNLVLKYKKVRP